MRDIRNETKKNKLNMKKIILFALIAIAMSSCTKTKDEIAREFIESQIKEGMNDPSSYEFASMTPLDSVFSLFKNEDEAKEIRKEINHFDIKSGTFERLSEDTYSNRSVFSKQQMAEFKDSMEYYKKILAEKEAYYAEREEKYQPRMEGYKTTFSCRGKNAFGAMIKNTYEIILNENLDSIISAEMITE